MVSGLEEMGKVRIDLSWENRIMVMSGSETSGGRLKKCCTPYSGR